ncbi:MAG: ABC transporter ATP-binding protein [Anaeroplasmataceae bacterium]
MLFNKYLNKYYIKYIFLLLIGLLALIIVDYVQLYIPMYLGNIVDTINHKLDMNINKLILNVVIVAIILAFGRVCFRLSIFSVSKKIESSLRSELFDKATRLSTTFYHNNNIGTIMTWFTSDLETIEEFLGWGSVMLVDASFLAILVVIRMLKLDYVLSIICFIPIILLVVWGLLVERVMTKKWELRQQTFDKLYDYSRENFTGIRVIKAFVKETKEIHYFSKIVKKNKDANVAYAKMSVLFDVIIEILIALIMCLLLGFGGYFVYSYINNDAVIVFGHTIELTSGELVSFLGYYESLIWPMIALGRIVAMRSKAKASLIRVSRYLDTEEDIKNPINPTILNTDGGKIEFKNFTFKYPDSSYDSISNISLVINKGEKIGIVGKVGSGKTTLVNSLFRLYNIENNQIFIDDVDIMNIDITSLRDNISYVPQENFLFSDEILGNIRFANPNASMKEVEAAVDFADLKSNIEGFKDGYHTVTGERGVTLSGGQKQRLSIARAYMKKSPIMILDDSVSAVDLKTEENILKHIDHSRNGLTTILIASRASTVMHMDKVIVLNNGRLEAFDTPENLLKNSPTFSNMVRLQELEKLVEGGDIYE